MCFWRHFTRSRSRQVSESVSVWTRGPVAEQKAIWLAVQVHEERNIQINRLSLSNLFNVECFLLISVLRCFTNTFDTLYQTDWSDVGELVSPCSRLVLLCERWRVDLHLTARRPHDVFKCRNGLKKTWLSHEKLQIWHVTNVTDHTWFEFMSVFCDFYLLKLCWLSFWAAAILLRDIWEMLYRLQYFPVFFFFFSHFQHREGDGEQNLCIPACLASAHMVTAAPHC